MKELKPEETELIGMWLDLGSKVVGDAVYDRIEWLTGTQLEHLADDPSGLATLYRDPRDKRLWERTYPFKGGPPQLCIIAAEHASEKYRVTTA
ncbi:MAG: hypothetical protein FD174_3358 [Geobacteraceae bacterium]|nr:MAG: hypothetical protein FD174_3358 [Geobacteraceae bacterium]